MSEYRIRGGTPLCGSVAVGGAKNAILPLLCASLLCTEGEVLLSNCPSISDVSHTLAILRNFGCRTSFENGQIRIDATRAAAAPVPDALSGTMRSSSLFLGAACGRFGKAEQYYPGGCSLGSRPIDLHLAAFQKAGIHITEQQRRVICAGRPHSTDIFLSFPSVGATENILLLAALGSGTVTVTGAAKEPEIEELQQFLNAMGARISGAGGDVILIEGVEKLHGVGYTIMGDRIEAATLLIAGLATDGKVTVTGAAPRHLTAVTDLIVNSGGSVCCSGDAITVTRGGPFLLSPGRVETAPYPGFPTDAQSPVIAMLACASGRTEIKESVFSDRLRVCAQLNRMGADITVEGTTALVRGVERLYGCGLSACDLRSGAALVIAALSAGGDSVVKNISHIERGYDHLEEKLRSLGADIIKSKDGPL